jgi:hypothetical protein
LTHIRGRFHLHHNEAKEKIKAILESDISFDGHFDKCFDNIKETKQHEILLWLKECRMHNVSPIQSKFDNEVIGFVKRIGSSLRIILTKKKDSYFIALFLDKHKYYETEMERQGF